MDDYCWPFAAGSGSGDISRELFLIRECWIVLQIFVLGRFVVSGSSPSLIKPLIFLLPGSNRPIDDAQEFTIRFSSVPR